jgi:hypothetical protein
MMQFEPQAETAAEADPDAGEALTTTFSAGFNSGGLMTYEGDQRSLRAAAAERAARAEVFEREREEAEEEEHQRWRQEEAERVANETAERKARKQAETEARDAGRVALTAVLAEGSSNTAGDIMAALEVAERAAVEDELLQAARERHAQVFAVEAAEAELRAAVEKVGGNSTELATVVAKAEAVPGVPTEQLSAARAQCERLKQAEKRKAEEEAAAVIVG